MNRSLKIAGWLMLLGAGFTALWLVAAFTDVIDPKTIFRFIWVASPLPYIGLGTAFGGNSGLASAFILAFLVGIMVSLVGGILTLRKKPWGISLAGSIGMLISVPILGATALVLVVRSKGEFTRRPKL